MPLLSDMIPFGDFWADGKSLQKIEDKEIPAWLEKCPKENAKQITYYRNTGGLRRRLVALYKAALNLARLHTNGLVYGDISPNNIFISNDLNYSDVWLIDADNLRFESESGIGVYTPGYGAPELVQRKSSGTTRADCHAFAVLAFGMLSMVHPFVGKKVDGEDSDWADTEPNNEFGDIQEQAYAGLLPYIDDLNDDSNSNGNGFPRALVLTDGLKRICQRTFGDARTEFWKRPTMLQWAEVLAEAVDQVVQCSECQMSWYYDVQDDTCPYCGQPKPSMLILDVFRQQDTLIKIKTFANEIKNEIKEKIEIPLHIFTSFTVSNSSENGLIVQNNTDHITLQPTGKVNVSFAVGENNGGQFTQLKHNTVLPRKMFAQDVWMRTDDTDVLKLIRCTITEVN
jgi:serine/threonine protein kinase